MGYKSICHHACMLMFKSTSNWAKGRLQQSLCSLIYFILCIYLYIYLFDCKPWRSPYFRNQKARKKKSLKAHSFQANGFHLLIYMPHLKEQVEAVKLLQLYVCLIYKKKKETNNKKNTANSIHRWGLIWCWQIWQVVSLNAGKWEVFNSLSTDQEGDEISHYICLHSKPALIFSTLKCCSRFYTSSGKNANKDFSLAIWA